MICDWTKHIYRELDKFTEDKTHFLESAKLFNKFSFMGIISFVDPQEDEE
jgi:hypothetical protein